MNIPSRFAYLAVMIGVLGHASSEVVAVLTGVSGPELSVWRYLLGGAGLVAAGLALTGFSALRKALLEGGPSLALISLYGVAGAYLAFHWALDFASPVQVAVLVTTIPFWVGVANWVLAGQAMSGAKIAAAVCAFAGLVVLLTDGALERLQGDADSLIGLGLALICAALASVYAVQIKPYVAAHGALPTTAVSLMIGGVALWLTVGALWGDWVDPTTLFARAEGGGATALNPGWWILVLALWNTTVTQLLWIGGLAAAPDMTRASYLFFLKPVIAALLALAFLQGAQISPLQWAAVALVTGSVLVELLGVRLGRRGPEAGKRA